MNYPVITFAGGGVVALILLWHWTRSHPKFDLSDLVTGDDGRVSATKFAQTGAFVVATWGFATLVEQGKMTEWYFTGYMLAFVGARLTKDALTKAPHASSITVTQSST